MKRITCEFCAGVFMAEDADTEKLKVCPYCGASIRGDVAFTEYDSLDKAIYGAISQYGKSILSNSSQMTGYMMDRAIGLSKELRIFAKIVKAGYAGQIRDLFDMDVAAAKVAVDKLHLNFVEEEGLSDEWAGILCAGLYGAVCFTKGIGMTRLAHVRVEDMPGYPGMPLPRRAPSGNGSQTSGTRTVKMAGTRNNGQSIACGGDFIIGIKKDRTVAELWRRSSSNEFHLERWNNIVSVACGDYHVAGLRIDGTVAVVGDDEQARDVSGWRDIVAIGSGSEYTVGLKADGTVVAVGKNKFGECDVSEWSDIIAISDGFMPSHTVGVKSDGTVVATGDNVHRQCEVGDWTNIVAVASSWTHTVGLKADGTVVATGKNASGQCNVGEWKDIVAVACGDTHTVGLKSDGTVVATGGNKGYMLHDVEEWRDIVAVTCCWNFTVGLKSDGSVVATGAYKEHLTGWRDIKV